MNGDIIAPELSTERYYELLEILGGYEIEEDDRLPEDSLK